MDHFGLLSHENTLAANCTQSVPGITREAAQAERHNVRRPKHERPLLDLGIRVLRSAVERGDTHVAGWLLERNPEFMELVQIAEGGATEIVEDARKWLRNARAFEERNGVDSMLKPGHPMNVRLAAAAQRQAERAS